MSLPNNYVCEGQMSIFDLGTWCGKMCPELSAQTKERISGQSLRKQQKSVIKMPLFLDLRGGGNHQDVFWEMGGALLGEYMMPSFGEFPSVEKGSLLSQILEENPLPKYSLSPKACQGILRRAEKRGKTLPHMLREALERQSAFKNEPESRGGVKESSYNMREQEPYQRLTTKVYCLQGNEIDRPAVYSIGHDIRSAKITDDEITDPLTATDYKDPTKVYQQNVGALCARDFKGVGNEYAEQDKVICEPTVRRLTPMECERLQGYPDYWTDIGEWTDTKGKIHKDSDTPRYKAIGNSIALPFWEWMAKRMVKHMNTEKLTMASLFDGIGGFPLVYTRAGCEPVWASEIEEFPIAVTKIRFPDDKPQA